MRALAFAAAFALIGSAAGAQTMNTTEKTTTTMPETGTMTTTKTHTSTMAMHSDRHMMGHRHAMRHCTTKWRNGHKMRNCKMRMMHKM